MSGRPPGETDRALSARLLEAQEEERARVARELHDDLIQRLGLVGHKVAGLRGVLDDPPTATRRLAGLEAELGDLCEEVRRLARRMHPSILDNLGLAAALRVLASDIGATERLAVRVAVDDPPPVVSPAAALSLYRVAQEALRNVIRHAAAEEATVRLAREEGGVVLEVVDGGCGFDLDGGRCGPGLGVTSMNERLRLVRGTLRLVSAPGSGTRVIAWVPGEGA